MNEQIVITKNNSGIELEVQFIDNKKKPIDITGCTVEIAFKDPNGEVTEHQAYIKNYTNGTCGFMLEIEQTNIANLWSTYWSATREDGFVTAQEAIYYYVIPMYGGDN